MISDDEPHTYVTNLKGKVNEFNKLCPEIFNSDLKEFFKNIASEDENYNDYNLLSK